MVRYKKWIAIIFSLLTFSVNVKSQDCNVIKKSLHEVSLTSDCLKEMVNILSEKGYIIRDSTYVQVMVQRTYSENIYNIHFMFWYTDDMFYGNALGAHSYGIFYFNDVPFFFYNEDDKRLIRRLDKLREVEYKSGVAMIRPDVRIVFSINVTNQNFKEGIITNMSNLVRQRE